MKLFIRWRQKSIVGLDIDEGVVVILELIKKVKQILLGSSLLLSNLKELNGNSAFKEAGAVISLPAQMILFRSFHVAPSLLKSNKQKELMAFLQRQNLPLKLEECFWDTFTMNGNLNLIAAKKDVVNRYVAQVEEVGLRCVGVTASFTGLYNVLIYNYPEREKNRFAVLNIRSFSSDLVIYESKRIWIYPLSIGKNNLSAEDSLAKFSTEVQRIFNMHYLQNPLTTQKAGSFLYLCGQENSEALVASLTKVLSGFEINMLDPLKNIPSSQGALKDKQVMALSLGLGLTYLEITGGLKINLIKERVKKEECSIRFSLMKKFSLSGLTLLLTVFLLWDASLVANLKKQGAIYKKTDFQIRTLLPQVKILKEEKEQLNNLQSFLNKKLNQQALYLEALARVSESRSRAIGIKEVEAAIKDERLNVLISGTASSYEEINTFLSSLKKNQDITGAKVVASTFPAAEPAAKVIDFKLRFEIK